MIAIAGCLILKDNKILMVKEAKKKCYGQWNFPAGHVDEPEKITDVAIRELYEETGCKVKLTGVLPMSIVNKNNNEPRLMVIYTADIIEENIKFNKEEILEVQWIDIDKLKKMKIDEIRAYKVILNFVKNFEANKIYPIEIIDTIDYK